MWRWGCVCQEPVKKKSAKKEVLKREQVKSECGDGDVCQELEKKQSAKKEELNRDQVNGEREESKHELVNDSDDDDKPLCMLHVKRNETRLQGGSEEESTAVAEPAVKKQ